jgi:hypothetical protein
VQKNEIKRIITLDGFVNTNYTILMKRKYEGKAPRNAVDVPFSAEETIRFRGYLKATGRKAGAWFRILAIRAMDMEDGRGDGSGQAREMADAIKAAR